MPTYQFLLPFQLQLSHPYQILGDFHQPEDCFVLQCRRIRTKNTTPTKNNIRTKNTTPTKNNIRTKNTTLTKNDIPTKNDTPTKNDISTKNNIPTRTLLPLLALLPDEALPIEQVGVNLLHCLLKVSRQLHLQIKSWMAYGWYDVKNKPSPRVLREMQLSQLSSCRGSTPPPPPSPWHTGSLPGDRLTWSS